MPRYYSATASISLLALALAGCNKSAQDMSAATASPSPGASPDSGLPALPAALPMQTGPASQVTTAPPVSSLPARHYVSVARPASGGEGYAYLDRASDIEDEIGDAPPDYDYQDDGVSPYVWQTGGGDYRYAEPVDGGYRYYYYQRGAQYPYLVRTNNYSYAYAGAALVAVYALSGALLPPDRYGGYRDDASRYFSRGEQLRQYNDQSQHRGVNAANWADQRSQFSAAHANWAAARSQQPAWQAYHAQNDPSQQPGWQQEHQQRQQAAQQFSGWQSHGFSGSPPPALAATGAHGDGQHGYSGQTAAPVENGAGHEMSGRQGGLPQPEAQHQAPANKAMTQQAKDAQRAADLRQQTANQAQHQQNMAAAQVRQGQAQQRATQQHALQQREAQQREAQDSARQAQTHALAAQRQAETAKVQESRAHSEAANREHTQPVPVARERAPEAQRPVEPQRPAEARKPVEMQRPAEAQKPSEAKPHAEPGHEHDHEHEHQ